jgi:hypothetical protein
MKNQKNKNNEKGNALMKGYILSVSALLLFSVVIMFARDVEFVKQEMKDSYHNAVQISKLNYFINDISSDLQNLVFVDYVMNNVSADMYNITIIDNMSINKTSFFSNYIQFLQGYANITGANISFSYYDPLIVNFNNRMQYSSKLDGTSIIFKNSSGTSSAAGYNISITANVAYVNYTEWSWAANGTYINIYYSGPSQSFTKSGYINASVLNQFVINYSSGNVKILAGLVDGAGNAIEVNQTLPNHLSSVRINSTLPSVLPIYYNTGLNISYLNTNYAANVPA